MNMPVLIISHSSVEFAISTPADTRRAAADQFARSP
jgi:hypothetical protein